MRTSPTHLPALDGLRAIAILLVLWVHFPFVQNSTGFRDFWNFGQAIRAGYLGVDLFFALSGFLITRLLLDERRQTGRVALKLFYARRTLRIFPIYYLCVLFYALCFRHQGDLPSLVTYTFNYFKPFHPSPMALEQTWSLSVEEQFYLFWPLLIRSVPISWGRAFTLVVIPVISLAFALVIAASFENALAADMIYMFGLTRMMSLSLGAGLAFLESRLEVPATGVSSFTLACGVTILVLDSVGRHAGIVPSGGYYWCAALVGYSLTSFGVVSILVGGRDRLSTALRRLLSFRVLRHIGRVSYGLYLYHYIVLFLFGLQPSDVAATGTSLGRFAAAALVTLLVTELSYRVIEMPLLRRKDALHPRKLVDA